LTNRTERNNRTLIEAHVITADIRLIDNNYVQGWNCQGVGGEG